MSRDKILAKIRANKPEEDSPILAIPLFQKLSIDQIELAKVFHEKAIAIGSTFSILESIEELPKWVSEKFPSAKLVCSPISSLENICTKIIDPNQDGSYYKDVDVAIMRGEIGVAENAAVWVNEKNMGVRVLPFITQHLVLIIKGSNIVGKMHEAYQKIDVDETGFGVFIAGPSKTADIEQSLVIGAQAARSCHVVLID